MSTPPGCGKPLLRAVHRAAQGQGRAAALHLAARHPDDNAYRLLGHAVTVTVTKRLPTDQAVTTVPLQQDAVIVLSKVTG